MHGAKRYKITAKNIEYLHSQYILADTKQEAIDEFVRMFDAGEIPVGSSTIQFQEIKIERR